MRLAIISDTHMPRGARALPAACVEQLRAADAILHAGDFVEAAVLAAIEALGPPVHAIRGNVDSAELQARLPLTRVVEAGGARVAMIHDAGPATGRLGRMRPRFPGPDAVDCGEGTQQQLLRSSVGLPELDAIFLTHFHLDHWLGVVGMLKTFDLRARERPLSVYGPPGLQRLFGGLRPIIGRTGYPLEGVDLEP